MDLLVPGPSPDIEVWLRGARYAFVGASLVWLLLTLRVVRRPG